MNGAVVIGTAAAIVAAAGTGFLAGESRRSPIAAPIVTVASASESGAPIYYQDPDGKPQYSLTPKKTPDGRAWRAVPASADVSFDEPEEPVEKKAVDAKTERKIKYYRNPMGLPDTSPVPVS